MESFFFLQKADEFGNHSVLNDVKILGSGSSSRLAMWMKSIL